MAKRMHFAVEPSRPDLNSRATEQCPMWVPVLVLALLWAATLAPLPASAQPAPPSRDIPPTYQKAGENELFELYANPDTIAFKVVDKRNGHVWHSNLDETVKGDRLNKTWTAFAASGISINYLDDKAQSKRASITNAPHSTEFSLVEGGFQAAVRFDDAAITVLVRVLLEGDGVRVEVPFPSLKQEDPAFKLGVLHLYPWLGATRTDAVPGYMFIPDGSGGLVRFSAETKARNMLYARYYGVDLGMIGEMPFDPATIDEFNMSLPVTGMAHNPSGEGDAAGTAVPSAAGHNAYISVVEKGAGYGEIQMHPAGVTTNFNFLYTAFIYNESYFQATNRAGAGVTALQRETNAFDVVVHHRFLAGADADYVGMARSYQRYLADRGLLTKAGAGPAASPHIGIRLEFLGGEAEKVLLWNRPIPMTTVDQMASIVADLDVKNPQVIYYGWQPNGASAQPPRTLKLDRSLGTLDQLRSLSDKLAAEGGRLYLYCDPQAAFWEQGGYSPRRDLAMSIGDAALVGFNRYNVNHYFNLRALNQRYSSLSAGAAERAGALLALDGIGTMLYTDFEPARFLNREQTIVEYQRLLAERGARSAFYRPNDYVFGFMDAYLDVPLTGSGYIYVDEVVPFLPIVLSGYVPAYGPGLNFSSNLRNDLLKMADYGVYPSFYLTHEPTANMLDTLSIWIFTSEYTQWAPEAERTYAWLDALLGPVKGQPVVARSRLSADVTTTTYANGKRVVVNYGDRPFAVDGTAVPARDALLLEAQP